MSEERCRLCGAVHCAGDECHPDVLDVLGFMYEAEDRAEKAEARVAELEATLEDIRCVTIEPETEALATAALGMKR